MAPSTTAFTFVPTPRNMEEVRGKFCALEAHPEFADEHRNRLQACELSFFAYDASLYDGPKEEDTFHSSYTEFRSTVQDPQQRALVEMRIRRAVFDHAALLDQLTGSTTLVVNIPGAAEPSTPASEEYVKAHAYFPGSIVSELERQHRQDSIPDLMQAIIREMGVPTLLRFERAVRKTWKVPRKARSVSVRPLPEIRGLPDTIPHNSSRYLFYGRKLDNRTKDLSTYGMDGRENRGEQGDGRSADATLSSSHLLSQAREAEWQLGRRF